MIFNSNMNSIVSAVARLMPLLAVAIVACSEEIQLPGGDTAGWNETDRSFGYLRRADASANVSTLDIYDGQAAVEFQFGLTGNPRKAVDVRLEVDPALLETYNKEQGTDYALFPELLLAIEEEGKLLVAPGKRPHPMALTLRTDESVDPAVEYAVPLRAVVETPGVEMDEGADWHLLVVRKAGTRPDAAKPSGVRTIVYVEVNDCSPLNAAQYTLKNSGKPIVDIVNIFAANINYDAVTRRAYIHMNENVSHILENRDKYIAPLQRLGIKVCLSILGNHTDVGPANLSAAQAADFAAQLRSVVDAYGLDGIDFDDEYASYYEDSKWTAPDGLEVPSSANYARLCYETKRAMPDKLVTVYHVGRYLDFNERIGGMTPGDFVDYAYYSMYGNTLLDGWENFLGMEKSQWGPFPYDISITSGPSNQIPSELRMRQLRNDGYGVNLLYNMRPYDYTEMFDMMADELYDDEILFTGELFSKDW